MTKLSVIICTYNRDFYILDALNSLRDQNAPVEDFEVIVVNNNCSDRTEEICLKFGQDNPQINFVHVVEKNQGLSFARNKGILVANSPLITFIDDDAIARVDYVSNLIKCFNDYPQYQAIGGKVIPIYPNDKEPMWMSKYIQRLVSKVDDGPDFTEFKRKYPVGCNMAFRKEIFEITGGFNTDLTLRSDDKYIFSKLKKHKMRTLYAPNVLVRHNIEGFRLEHSFIKKLSRLNGHTERVRLRKEHPLLTFVKLFDYLVKFGAALLIGTGFLLKGKKMKAKYLVMVMWLSMMGFVYYKEKK